VRLAEPRLAKSKALLAKVLGLAIDAAPRVRFQVAFTLGEVHDPAAVAALAEIARRDAADEWTRTALLSSVASRAGELLATLGTDRQSGQDRGLLYRELGQLVGIANRPGEVQAVLSRVAERADDKAERAPLALGLAEGLRRKGTSLGKVLAADTPAARWVEAVLAEAERTARTDKAPAERRRQAVQVLGCGELSQVQATLAALLDARQAPPVQTAAVQTLQGFRSPAIPKMLLGSYRGLTPIVRAAVVEALTTRAEWLTDLLDAVEKKIVPRAEVPLARRNALARLTDAKLRERAVALFGREVSANRRQVVEAYRGKLHSSADKENGRKIFVRECQQCHRLGEIGHDVGPNLATIQHRSPDEVLLHVLDPNREIAPNYLEYALTLKDGRLTRGVIVAETENALTLGRPLGERETVLRTQIDEIASTGQSLMPEGFEKNITPRDMADLLAFILEK
jgi:putative heme-binding domain-containing protein